MAKSPTILVVDDEAQIRTIVEHRLEADGYQVISVSDGDEALKAFEAHQPDLIVLDLMMPQVDGFQVCERVKAKSNVPIIILSAKGDELDKVVGFRMGADDYLTKPFSPSELALRVQAVLRRTHSFPVDDNGMGREGTTCCGDIEIDRRRRKVWVRGQAVDLTAKEFDLLWFFASHPEYVFTREQLLNQVWDDLYPSDPNNVTVLVSRLRDKIEEDPHNPCHIKTVWGVGYKFETGESQ